MENARLLTEQREALEQQTATAEVMRVINTSLGDLTPVFDTILEKARRICNIDIGSLAIYDGEFFRAVATHGYEGEAEIMARTPYRPLATQRELLQGARLIHIPDLQAHTFESDETTIPAFVQASGFRAGLMIPLRKDGALLGFLTGYRKVAGPFSDKQITLLENFAAQAVIAMENARLLRELQQRTEELAKRNSEYGERIEQQAATIDVLKVMSSSPGDAQPVFRLIVERARAFCEADGASLALLSDDMLDLQAYAGFFHRDYEADFPRRVSSNTMFGRAVLACDVVQMPDVSLDPNYYSRGRPGQRAIIALPLLRAGIPIGAIAIGRSRPGEFSSAEVELLRTFADRR